MTATTPARPVTYTHLFGDLAKLAAQEGKYSTVMVYRVAEDHFDDFFKGASFSRFEEIYTRLRNDNIQWRDERAEDDDEREACQNIIDVCDQEIALVRAYIAERG